MVEGSEFESVIDGDKVKLKLAVENLSIERRCDTEYHLAYTQLLQRGVLPRASLEKLMAKQKVWTPDDEEELHKIQRLLLETELRLDSANTHEQGLAIASEMGKLRADCLQLVQVKANVIANSCESLADQVRRDAYLAFATVHVDTNKPVFKDYDDFLERAMDDDPVIRDARERILAIATADFQHSLMSLPEVSYVHGIEIKIQADDKKAADEKVADEKAAKKKTNKKTSKKSKKKVAGMKAKKTKKVVAT